jgi:hypothetical protein
MANVSVKQIPKPTEYESEIRVEYIEGGSSVMGQISWENPITRVALCQMFDLKPHESLAAIIITKEGIKAEIKTQR